MGTVVQIVLVVTGAVVTIDGCIRIAGSIMGETVGRRSRALRRLRRLGANMDVGYFSEVLGAALLRRSRGALTEVVWMDRYYFVQAFTDADRRVVMYSVTSKRERFRPKVQFPGGGVYLHGQQKPFVVKLNKTPLAASGTEPGQIHGDVGARRFWYSEVYDFGNPGHYQTLVLSVNDASPSVGDFEGILTGIHEAPEVWDGSCAPLDLPSVCAARLDLCPNTYTVTAPLSAQPGTRAGDGYWGVDLDAVRVFPNP